MSRSALSGGLILLCLEVENYIEGAQHEYPEIDRLRRVVLRFPKALEYIDSFPY